MNAKQYKEWYRKHAKDLQRIRHLDNYAYMAEIFTDGEYGHMAEYRRDQFDEFIIEILGTINDHCNKETDYHSSPHKGCILR